MKPEIKGTIYYVSDNARRRNLYKEGQKVTIDMYNACHYLSDTFVQVDLDGSGISYLHIDLRDDTRKEK